MPCRNLTLFLDASKINTGGFNEQVGSMIGTIVIVIPRKKKKFVCRLNTLQLKILYKQTLLFFCYLSFVFVVFLGGGRGERSSSLQIKYYRR